MTRRERWKKSPIRILMIVFCAAVLHFALLFGFLYYCSLSLVYVSSLDWYNLKTINGSVETISRDIFKDEIVPELKEELSKIYLEVFPVENVNSDVSFFCFAEMVKKDNKRRNVCDRWELYLSCTWSNDDYQAEKERISSIHYEKKKPLFSNNLFPLPSYIFSYNYDSIFSYVLFDDSNNQIYYIFLMEIGSLDNIVFDKTLAPHKPIIKSDLRSKTPLFCDIYYLWAK